MESLTCQNSAFCLIKNPIDTLKVLNKTFLSTVSTDTSCCNYNANEFLCMVRAWEEDGTRGKYKSITFSSTW